MRIFLICILAITTSCNKNNGLVFEAASPTEILIRKHWVLTSFGYDENENGIIDPSEESIADCEKDNTYFFEKNGEGGFAENALVCGNGITEHPFTWKWLDVGKQLEIDFQPVSILRLNEKELTIFTKSEAANGRTVKFLFVYRR